MPAPGDTVESEAAPGSAPTQGTEPDGGESGSPSFDGTTTSSLPADCLITRGDDGARYCYTRSTRELLAVEANGAPRFRFALPGEDATNEIRAIAFAGSRLVILATTRTDSSEAVEFSTFSSSGAFLATHPIKLPEQPVRLRSDPASISAAGDDTALYVTARLVATGKGEPAGYLPSSALARYALHDGRKEAYRSWADGEPPQVVPTNDARLDLVRDGTRVSVNARTLSAVDSPLVNTGNAETVRHETRYWLEGGWMALVGEAREALRAAPADQVSGTSYEAPRACPGGDTETYTRSADSNGYAVSYEACIVGDYTLTGRIENDNSITNRSSDSTDLYDRLRIVRTGRDPVTLELDATVRRENLGAGRQACQGENSNRLEATARRVVLVSGNTTATMNEGIYTVAEVTTSPTGYNPQTFACDYVTTLASSGEMNVTGMLGDPDPWQLSHPTRTRMSATAADGSAIELVGALDGVQLDRFVVGGQATQPSFRFGGEVSDAWGGL